MSLIIVYVVMTLLTFTGFAVYEKYDSKYVEKELISTFIAFSIFWPLVIPTLLVVMVFKWVVNFLYKLVNK